MAVYFEPESKGRSWLDYAAPIVMQLIGDAMGRTNQARDFKMQQRAADEDAARKQRDMQWRAEQLYGREQSRPLSGPEQALNVAGYTPGSRPPATSETYREGGILNGLDIQGNQNDAIRRILASLPLQDSEAVKQYQHILGNLNPGMEFQTVDQGDRMTAGPFDKRTGNFAGQEYMYGTDPTKQYGYDKTLEGIMEQVAGNRDVARINASRPYAPKAEPRRNLRPVQTEQGIMLLDPDTGEMIPTGQNPPPKGGDTYGKIKGLIEDDDLDDEPEGDGFWGGLAKWYLGDAGNAGTPATTPQEAYLGKTKTQGTGGITQQEIAELIEMGFSEEEIAAMMKK